MNEWHQISTSEALHRLQSSTSGLSVADAAERFKTHGPNQLQERSGRSPVRMLWEQFTQTIVLILIVAAVASMFMGKQVEAIAIGAIVVMFGVLGFLQEYRAEKAMAALKRMAVPNVRVRRGGVVVELPSRELVPGDIILLEAGNAVPCDVRLVESVNLRIQESALTGESEPVEKVDSPIEQANVPLGDRRNMSYLGTAVTYGRGSAIVVATGMNTELGKIAIMIQEVPVQITPLQQRLDQVGKFLALVGGVTALLVMAVGLWRGESLVDMVLTAISVAVAVVPEGLPAVVTITLALGAQRMLSRHALIRKLPAVETLGSVTIICSDKTGTLTENRMTVMVVDVAGTRMDCVEELHRRHPSTSADQLDHTPHPPAINLALVAGALCNDALLQPGSKPGDFSAIGDPTESALLIAAVQSGLTLEALQAALPRVAEIPFDSNRKRMTTTHRLPTVDLPDYLKLLNNQPYVLFTKGAVDGLLQLATQVWVVDHIEPMSEEWRKRIDTANQELAQQGMRVLGLGLRQLATPPQGNQFDIEQELVIIGLVGMIDPPRSAVKAAVRTCTEAGIRPIMITGDHPLTAAAIARELGISSTAETITGTELTRMSDAELDTAVTKVSIFARVAPEDKLRIVTALQRRGEVVAMTGDGVNDSPALKKADIGVAMGITGTDVAKEAANMVLLDDNFATIVAAVEEGRVIYDNLVRFIKYSLGGNLGKVIVMLGAPLLGVNVALRPLQLLWLNLLTDGLMGLGLGVEPAEADTMSHPPRRPDAPVLDSHLLIHVTWVGALMAVISLWLAAFYVDPTNPHDTSWQTVIFMTLGLTQIGNAIALRASGRSPFSVTSNPLMTFVTVVALILQLVVVYLSPLNQLFGLTPLPMNDLLLVMVASCGTFVAIRLEQWLTRKSFF